MNGLALLERRYAALKPLDLIIGGKKFTLNANAQIWPRALNAEIGGDADGIYLIVSTYGNTFPFQYILGLTFLYVNLSPPLARCLRTGRAGYPLSER